MQYFYWLEEYLVWGLRGTITLFKTDFYSIFPNSLFPNLYRCLREPQAFHINPSSFNLSKTLTEEISILEKTNHFFPKSFKLAPK